MVNVIKSISKAFGKLSGNTLNPDEVISHKASEDIAEEKSSAQKDIEAKLLQMAIDYLQDSTRCKAEVVRRCLATSAYYKGYKNAPEIATMHSNDGYIADNEGRIIKKNTNYMIRASQLIVARTLAVNPDCYVAPSTSWEVDIEAARAGRQITSVALKKRWSLVETSRPRYTFKRYGTAKRIAVRSMLILPTDNCTERSLRGATFGLGLSNLGMRSLIIRPGETSMTVDTLLFAMCSLSVRLTECTASM